MLYKYCYARIALFCKSSGHTTSFTLTFWSLIRGRNVIA